MSVPPLSSIIFLSDCTPLYTTLGAPGRIASVSTYPLYRSVRLEWSLPPNSNEVIIDAYIVRYGKYGAPSNLMNNYITVFLPTVVVPNLDNGVLYSFWVSAKNRFGESPLSPTVSSYAGGAPSPIQLVRRSYHASTQNVGIEFTPSINNNGNVPTTFTIKYRLMNGGIDISYTQVESVQTYEQIKDASNNSPLNSDGVKGNFIRKEVIIPGGIDPGRYRFTVLSSNIYGTSAASDTYFDVDLPFPTGIFSVRAPSFSYRPPVLPALPTGLPNGDIYSITPLDGAFRLKWYKYKDTINNAPLPAPQPTYAGWVYRIQYTDNKDYWYYSLPSAGAICYPEYTVPYNAATDASGIYTFDISMCVVNGRRYYVRYCVVAASGDASEYTQITDTNLDKTTVIPGKAPNPPPIFYASVDDRLIRLYFNWTPYLNSNTYPPSLNLTGGYPILDYRIDRFKINRNDGIYSESFDIAFNNIAGPYYEDTYDLRVNGMEYLYRVYTRTSFGYSLDYTSVTAIPSRKSDIVHDVTASVGNNQITLSWLDPYDIDPDMPISQYYIEYRIYDIYSVPLIPPDNIVGNLTNTTTIGNNIQDMNAILVDDALWGTLSTTIVEKYTNNLNRSYTITDLINNKPYVFRVAAVTMDRVRRKLVGLMQVIDDASPYLSRPTIIGVVPSRLTNMVFINFSEQIKIEWNSTDINNSQNIIRFHVDYRIAGSGAGVLYTRQSFEYLNCLLYNDTTTAYFSVVVVGLENNVAARPATNSDSYEMYVFAENSVGFTNTEDKIRLHDLRNTTNSLYSLKSPYENLSIQRYVRPMNIANTVNEQR
jgi:hypothetical protein